MRKLVDGIHRFQSGVFGKQKDLLARLSKGQEPDAFFITCSDSRVSPRCWRRWRRLHVMAFDDATGQYLPVAEAGHRVAERADRLSAIRQI